MKIFLPPLFPLLAAHPPPLTGEGNVALKVCAAEVVPERGQIVPEKQKYLKKTNGKVFLKSRKL